MPFQITHVRDGAVPATTYHPGMAGRLVSPTLVGRASELAALEDALDRAVRGTPVHQLVAGEAGVGKSRLVRETSSLAAARGFRVLSGACADVGEGGVPYGPIVEALRTLVRGLEPAAIDSIVGRRARDLARLVPALGSAPEPSTPTEFVAPRLLDGILGVLQRLAEVRPVLFIVEDLHWADAATREAIAFLARQLDTDRVLLLMTFRADELHRRHPLLPWIAELERSGRVERVALVRLDADQTARAARGDPRRAADAVARRRGSTGDRTATRSSSRSSSGPARRRGSGRSRRRSARSCWRGSSRCPSRPSAVVHVAAVAGRRVDHDLLAEVAGMDDDALIDGAPVGGRRARPRDAGGAGDEVDGDYAFRHALLQEAAYDDLLPGERQRLHRAFAEVLATRGPGSGAPAAGHWAELAWHLSAARDVRRAFEASVRATDAATRAYAFADAQRHGERALEQWSAVDDAEAIAGMDRAALLDMVAQAAWLASDSRRSVALRREAIVALGRRRPGPAGDRPGAARAGAVVPRRHAGGAGGARDGDRAHPGRSADARARAGARGLRPDPHARRPLDGGDGGAARGRSTLARRTGARQAEGHARNSLGLCLAVGGLYREGYASLEAALRIAHEIGSPDDIGRAYVNLCSAYRYAGDPAGGLEVVRRGVVAATQFGLDRTYAYFIRSNGVQCATELDAWDEGMALADASIGSPADGRVHRRYGLANALPLLVARGDERTGDAPGRAPHDPRGHRRGGPVPRPVVDRRDRVRAVAGRPERGARCVRRRRCAAGRPATGAGTTSGCAGSACRRPRTRRRLPARGGTGQRRPAPARPATPRGRRSSGSRPRRRRRSRGLALVRDGG